MLKGKKFIVTGGGSGIGRSTSIELAQNGAEVLIIGRSEEKLINTVSIADSKNLVISYKVCDVSDAHAVAELFENLNGLGFVPNGVVNAAGVINIRKADGAMDDEIVLKINTLGTILMCEAAIQSMIRHGIGGGIVNIASIAGHDGSSEYPSYAASKGAILSYTKSLAMKHGKDGIRINSISPGVIHTAMSYVETPNFDDYIPELIQMHPLRRLGTPEDIAKVAVFLLSDNASFVTGQDLIVDGGYTLRE